MPLIIAVYVAYMAAGPDGPPRVDVSLTSPSREFLLGEAVPLSIVVRNGGDRALTVAGVLVDVAEPEINVYLSTDGKRFDRLLFSNLAECVARHRESLAPGESFRYRLRVLYSDHEEGGLAFDRPGTYFVKVIYPLHVVKPGEGDYRIESNVIRIRVRAPAGLDASVWERIQSKDSLRFLQDCSVIEGREDIVLRIYETLRESPDTGYRGTLRHAVRKFVASAPTRLGVDESIKILEFLNKNWPS
jgi:hypothetical protein